jgi:5S rRNA maturation endonuclease (ribonuclease M5)
MYAIEFETDITGKYIELKDYEQLLNKHAKVIILVDEDNQSEKPVTKVMKQLQQFNEIINQRVNLPKVDKEIDINALCNEINSDIF